MSPSVARLQRVVNMSLTLYVFYINPPSHSHLILVWWGQTLHCGQVNSFFFVFIESCHCRCPPSCHALNFVWGSILRAIDQILCAYLYYIGIAACLYGLPSGTSLALIDSEKPRGSGKSKEEGNFESTVTAVCVDVDTLTPDACY